MAGFENYAADARAIEIEIERKGIALGIDWSDEVQVRALAREAFEEAATDIEQVTNGAVDHQLMAKIDLFGLAAVMLRTMEESAGAGIESHGGPAWKAFGKALWAEAQLHRPK